MKEYLSDRKTLIMGLGNLLMGDEGVGIHIAEMLSKEEWPTQVAVLDGGTGGFHLLEYFEKNDNVILIDATLDGRIPGTIRQIKPKFAADFPPSMSSHDIGLRDLVNALQLLGKMPEIDLFVISIESIQQQGIYLTGEVEQAIPEVIRLIKALVEKTYFPEAVY